MSRYNPFSPSGVWGKVGKRERSSDPGSLNNKDLPNMICSCPHLVVNKLCVPNSHIVGDSCLRPNSGKCHSMLMDLFFSVANGQMTELRL